MSSIQVIPETPLQSDSDHDDDEILLAGAVALDVCTQVTTQYFLSALEQPKKYNTKKD